MRSIDDFKQDDEPTNKLKRSVFQAMVDSHYFSGMTNRNLSTAEEQTIDKHRIALPRRMMGRQAIEFAYNEFGKLRTEERRTQRFWNFGDYRILTLRFCCKELSNTRNGLSNLRDTRKFFRPSSDRWYVRISRQSTAVAS